MTSKEEILNIDLKNLIENETGQKFDRNNKIFSPFKIEKTPSFSIYFNSNKNKWMFKDFSSGEVGDQIDFIQKLKGMDYNQAREYLSLSSELTIQELQASKIEKYIDWQIKHQDNKKDYKLIGLFPFTDPNNNVLYYKAKFKKADNKKDISYYHLNNDKVVNNRGCDELPYNLYNTLQAIQNNDIIIITEGERNANKLNNMLKKGYCATSVKGIRELSKLTYFSGCKIYVCGDNGFAGEQYKQHIYDELFKESKVFKFIRLPGLNKMADNSDIEDWLEAGHNTNDLIEAFNKSLDLKNVYELQQDKHGIYKKVYSEKTENYKKTYISNFNIVGATSLRFIDEGLENIEITFKTEYGKTITRDGSVTVLDDIRSFKSFLNSIDLTFKGKGDDLNTLKEWINKYFLNDSCDIVNGNQFKVLNNELLYISPDGAIGADNTFDNIKSDEKVSNNILRLEAIEKYELEELMKYLFTFSNSNNTYSIIGTVINYLAIYQAIQLNIKFSHLLIVGEAGSGKSTILEQVVAALLNYPLSLKKSIGLSSGFSFTKDLSIGNYPAIYDEYKPSTFDRYKNQSLSNILRNAYDRQNAERGTKSQVVNSYKLNRPIIMAGEQSYLDNEKALIERSCIIYTSKNERTKENENSMKWLIKNNILLCKLGRRLIEKVLTINLDQYKTIRAEIEQRIVEYDFLNDRVLNTCINACIGIEILNKVLIDLRIPVLTDYFKYVVQNIKNEVLEDGEENYSDVENMIVKFNELIEDDRVNVENIITVRGGLLYIKTSEMLNQLRIFIKATGEKVTILSNKDFKKQAEKSNYILKKSEPVYLNSKTTRMDIYNIDKIRLLNLNSIIESDELTPIYDNEPIAFPI
ncbi:CHC2 zinc finger domain-containing protein [Clostridium beijerinckii]|uniref:DNA primase n=1 Tax=Clostridium beijerinckii TaxID=1520 RepID=A0A7X9SLZ6_CLOBE|nr:CHC2 zinc finger domain-containing protein [Clostridium beijerinckii]NMF04350.1 DNA primase [Clostridium beijerinckii]